MLAFSIYGVQPLTPKSSRLSPFAIKAASSNARQGFPHVLLCALMLCGLSVALRAQQTTADTTPKSPASSPTASNTNPDDMAATIVSVAPLVPEAAEEWGGDEAQAVAVSEVEKRLIHARSLAAIGNYAGAIQQLETVRAANTDAAIANVARVLLTGIYIEQADYKRASSMLDEAFNLRSTNGESGTQTYHAVAGQVLNGVRARLAHYRAYNVNIADRRLLPVEAANDLEGLRLLLDALVVQARTLQVQAGTQGKMHTDVAALFEDAAGVCLLLARDKKERIEWQRHLSDARQRLAAADARWQVNHADGSSRQMTAANITPARVNTNTPAAALSFASKRSPETANNTPNTNGERVRADADKSWSVPSSPVAPPATLANTEATPNTPSNTSAATATNQVVEIGQLAGKATQKVQPLYPSSARNARVTGIVTVVLIINEKGVVESARSTSGPEMLRRAAEDAARRWRFRQPLNGTQAGRVSGYINFNFVL